VSARLFLCLSVSSSLWFDFFSFPHSLSLSLSLHISSSSCSSFPCLFASENTNKKTKQINKLNAIVKGQFSHQSHRIPSSLVFPSKHAPTRISTVFASARIHTHGENLSEHDATNTKQPLSVMSHNLYTQAFASIQSINSPISDTHCHLSQSLPSPYSLSQ